MRNTNELCESDRFHHSEGRLDTHAMKSFEITCPKPLLCAPILHGRVLGKDGRVETLVSEAVGESLLSFFFPQGFLSNIQKTFLAHPWFFNTPHENKSRYNGASPVPGSFWYILNGSRYENVPGMVLIISESSVDPVEIGNSKIYFRKS